MSDAVFEPDRLNVRISQQDIQQRVAELGAQIRADYGDGAITCIGVLKGSFVFMADLVRAIGGSVRCEFLGVSSYHGGTHSSGVVQITQDLRTSIEGHDVLVIEDIIDTGLTMDYLLRNFRTRAPNSLKVATLLDKPSRREVSLSADYTGFSIPDEFVVGYGLDLGELYRNLPYIAVYQP